MNTVFEEMGAVVAAPVDLVGAGNPERIDAAGVTGGLFRTLGVQPLFGRAIEPADARDGAPLTAVLSYNLWQAVFGGDMGVLGRKIDLDGAPYVVIGIMPPDFRYPNQDTELWLPIQFPANAFLDRNNNYLDGIARLRPGVSLEQARAGMNVIAAQLRRQ
jgi:putative ABC transport system permease protein